MQIHDSRKNEKEDDKVEPPTGSSFKRTDNDERDGARRCSKRKRPLKSKRWSHAKKKLKALSAGDFLISATSDEGEGGGLPPILDLQLCS